MSTLDSIKWHGPAETWTWPPTEEQRARLTAYPALADGLLPVVALGPDTPDMIFALGKLDPLDIREMQEPGETMQVRFGSMPLADYEALPEHNGW